MTGSLSVVKAKNPGPNPAIANGKVPDTRTSEMLAKHWGGSGLSGSASFPSPSGLVPQDGPLVSQNPAFLRQHWNGPTDLLL